MDPNKKLNAQAVREQVDRRIAELESEIRALKTHRNTVAATSQLPPEILSNIFNVLGRVMGDGYSKPSWTRVNQVCRHWRAVALDCPALWSDLMFVGGNPAFTEVMLQRSKNAPLSVKFDAYSPPFNDILCKIVSQTSRLRDVELRQGSNTTPLDLPKILSSFESTAPILEKLVLEGVELDNWTRSDKYHTIPANFLQDGAPSLQHLDITRLAIHWDALPISITLTHLQLENVETRPTRKAFSESLAKLLRLETIKLSACLPHSGGASQPDSLPVILPSLRTLELQDLTAELRQFFSMTQIPEEARVHIKLCDRNPESESPGSLFSALRASWILPKDMVVEAAGDSAQPSILDLRIVDASRIKCWFSNHDLPPNFDVENPPASLVVSRGSPSIGIHLLLKAIAEHLDLSSLQSLKFDYFPLTKQTLALFKDLTKLDKIAIWNSHSTLSKFLGILEKKKGHALSFPSMRTIELRGIDFDEDPIGGSSTAVRALAAALKNLRKSHPTIERFTMTQCVNFLEKHWEALCKALPDEVKVYWDEVELCVAHSGW
ncbi:hypothetical protein EST38_g9424 [Candolleomyces aberdarensis]|uniref:F-box domain-containing protein n=1 Tax=Candolleomyces aberdarensis TaxID=2316362 RepID=A0A4V1Q2V8_9AGAR|nr:hypothetical protein EST38_g9424 [Candolleomyces aberdarensis]